MRALSLKKKKHFIVACIKKSEKYYNTYNYICIIICIYGLTEDMKECLLSRHSFMCLLVYCCISCHKNRELLKFIVTLVVTKTLQDTFKYQTCDLGYVNLAPVLTK